MYDTKIIAIAQEKGGVGKSTLSILISTNLYYLLDKKIVLLDLDNPQYSIANMRKDELKGIEQGSFSKEPYPIIPTTMQNLEKDINDLKGKVDYIFIDFPGQFNEEFYRGLFFVNYLFIPFSLDRLEVERGIKFYLETANRKENGKLPSLIKSYIIINKYRSVQKAKYNELYNLLIEKEFDTVKVFIKEREDYRDSFRSTINSISETNNSLSATEFFKFLNEFLTLTSI